MNQRVRLLEWDSVSRFPDFQIECTATQALIVVQGLRNENIQGTKRGLGGKNNETIDTKDSNQHINLFMVYILLKPQIFTNYKQYTWQYTMHSYKLLLVTKPKSRIYKIEHI